MESQNGAPEFDDSKPICKGDKVCKGRSLYIVGLDYLSIKSLRGMSILLLLSYEKDIIS
jgi:hypothetical protein